MDLLNILKLVVDFGVAGLLFSLLIYLFWKYIPGLQAAFTEAINTAMKQNQKQADQFRDALKEQQDLFLQAISVQREANLGMERSMDRLTTALMNHGPKSR